MLAGLAGKREEVVTLRANAKIGDLVEHLCSRSPDLKRSLVDEQGRKYGSLLIAINGKTIEGLDGMQTSLTSGDKIVFAPPYQGG